MCRGRDIAPRLTQLKTFFFLVGESKSIAGKKVCFLAALVSSGLLRRKKMLSNGGRTPGN